MTDMQMRGIETQVTIDQRKLCHLVKLKKETADEPSQENVRERTPRTKNPYGREQLYTVATRLVEARKRYLDPSFWRNAAAYPSKLGKGGENGGRS